MPNDDPAPQSRETPAEITRQMGLVAINGSALEAHIGLVLSLVLNVSSERALRIAGRLGATPTLDLIAELATTREILKWTSEARKAMEARNDAIHSAWLEGPNPGESTILRRRTLKEEPRSEEDLKRINDALHGAIVGAQVFFREALGGELGAP